MSYFFLSIPFLSVIASAASTANQADQKTQDMGPQSLTIETSNKEAVPYVLFSTPKFAFSWDDKKIHFKKDKNYQDVVYSINERVHAVVPFGDDVLFATYEGNVYFASAKDFEEKVKNKQVPFYKIGKLEPNRLIADMALGDDGVLHVTQDNSVVQGYKLTKDMMKKTSETPLEKVYQIPLNAWGVAKGNKGVYFATFDANIKLAQDGKVVKSFNIIELAGGKISPNLRTVGLAFDNNRNVLFIADCKNRQIHAFHVGADGQSWTYLTSIGTGGIEGLKIVDNVLYAGCWEDGSQAQAWKYNLRYADQTGIDMMVAELAEQEFVSRPVTLYGNFGISHAYPTYILRKKPNQKFSDHPITMNVSYCHVLMGVDSNPNHVLAISQNGPIYHLNGDNQWDQVLQIGSIKKEGYLLDGDWNKKDTLCTTDQNTHKIRAYTLTPDMLGKEGVGQLNEKWSFVFNSPDENNKKLASQPNTGEPGAITMGDDGLIYVATQWQGTKIHILKDQGNSAAEIKAIDLKELGAFISTNSNLSYANLPGVWFDRISGISYDKENKVLYVGAERMGCIYAFHTGNDGQTFTYLGSVDGINPEGVKVIASQKDSTELFTATYYDDGRTRHYFSAGNRNNPRFLKYKMTYIKGIKSSLQEIQSHAQFIEDMNQKAIAIVKKQSKDLPAMQKDLKDLTAFFDAANEKNKTIASLTDQIKAKTKRFENTPKVKNINRHLDELGQNVKISILSIQSNTQDLKKEVEKGLGQEVLLKNATDLCDKSKKLLADVNQDAKNIKKMLSTSNMTELEKTLSGSSSIMTRFSTYKDSCTAFSQEMDRLLERIEQKDRGQQIKKTFDDTTKEILSVSATIKPAMDSADLRLKKWQETQKLLNQSDLTLKNITFLNQLGQSSLANAQKAFESNTKKPDQSQCAILNQEKDTLSKILASAQNNAQSQITQLSQNESYLKDFTSKVSGPLEEISKNVKQVELLALSADKTLSQALDEASKTSKIKDLIKQMKEVNSSAEVLMQNAQSGKDNLLKNINSNDFEGATQTLESILKIDAKTISNKIDGLEKSCDVFATSSALKAMLEEQKGENKKTKEMLTQVNSLTEECKTILSSALKNKEEIEKKRSLAKKIKEALTEGRATICSKIGSKNPNNLREAQALFLQTKTETEKQLADLKTTPQLNDIMSECEEEINKAGVCIQDQATLEVMTKAVVAEVETDEEDETNEVEVFN